MKKTYIIPETYMQRVELQQMIALSGTIDANQSTSNVEDIGANGGGSLWDDED